MRAIDLVNKVAELEYFIGTLGNETEKWRQVFLKLLGALNTDIENLKLYTKIQTARGNWLDLFGLLFEVPRTTSSKYITGDTETEKLDKDNFYRALILAKINSIYDSYTRNVADDVSDIFGLTGKMLTHVFTSYIQFSFIGLTQTEYETVEANYDLLEVFDQGRDSFRVTAQVGDTFRFGEGGGFGKKFTNVIKG